MQAPKNIEEIYQEINNFAQSAEERSLIFRIPYITDLFAKIRGIHRFGEKEIYHLGDIIPKNRPALDIGAGSGLYTYHLLKRAKYCIAFEPRLNAAALLESRAHPWKKNLHIVNAAVSNGDSKVVVLRVPEKSIGWATIEKSNLFTPLENENINAINVFTVIIDKMNLLDVGFVKLDVEGHEISVLKGMKETIKKFRPNFLIETEDRHGGGGIKGIFEFMRDFDYSAYVVTNSRLKKVSQKKYTLMYEDKKAFNAIFLS